MLGFAQKGPELGGGVGVSHYFGDLNPDLGIKRPGLSATAVGRYNFNNRVATKIALSYGNVSGSDEDSDNRVDRERNLSFSSRILDVAGQIEFNFMEFEHGSKLKFFSPYVFAGANAYNYNPTTEYQGQTIELREVRTEGQFPGTEYNTWSVGLVYGLGFKYSLSYHWSLNFELSSRLLFSDYLDDVSTVYPDLDPDDDPLAFALSDRSIEYAGVDLFTPGQQRGNANDNDFYAFFTVSVLYYLGSLACPDYGR